MAFSLFDSLRPMDAQWRFVESKPCKGVYVGSSKDSKYQGYIQLDDSSKILTHFVKIDAGNLTIGKEYDCIVSKMQKYVRDENNTMNQPTNEFIYRVTSIGI